MKKRLWEAAYDKAVFRIPLTAPETEALEKALYWTVHRGSPPWPSGPKQQLIRELKRRYGNKHR